MVIWMRWLPVAMPAVDQLKTYWSEVLSQRNPVLAATLESASTYVPSTES